MKLDINEIFYSLQGEGRNQGIPMVFIRLQGCSLEKPCSYCDTLYSYKSTKKNLMEVSDIVTHVNSLVDKYNYGSWICITGGEPLYQEEGLHELVKGLKRYGKKIEIFTNASESRPIWWTLVDSWVTDIKCPSSGVCGVSKLEEWIDGRESDQIKLTVQDTEDLDFAEGIISKCATKNPQVIVSPVIPIASRLEEGSGEVVSSPWLQTVAEFCLEHRVRFSLQWHKIVWGNKRGV